MAGGASEDDMEPKTRNSAHRSGRGTGDSKPPSADTSADILLVYDMECPACDTYCRWVRLRPSAGRLHLVNARESTAVMEEIPMARLDRSEEHTSELQAPMRISYAVFCLKKQNNGQHREKLTTR